MLLLGSARGGDEDFVSNDDGAAEAASGKRDFPRESLVAQFGRCRGGAGVKAGSLRAPKIEPVGLRRWDGGEEQGGSENEAVKVHGR